MTGHDPWTLLSAAYLLSVLTVAVACDLRRLVIPNVCNAVSVVGALAFASQNTLASFTSCVIGGVVGAAALLGLLVGFRTLRGYDGLGVGDVRYMAGAGVWVGWQGLAPLLLIASVTALACVAAISLLGIRIDSRTRIPFAPFSRCRHARRLAFASVRVGPLAFSWRGLDAGCSITRHIGRCADR